MFPHSSRFLGAAFLCFFVGAHIPSSIADAAASGGCPVPVCRYQGTAWAEDLIGDELLDRGEAQIVWLFSHMAGREAVYVPTGKVSARWQSTHCDIELDPSEHEITAAKRANPHARLKVDFTVRPVRYVGIGTSGWAGQQTWTCKGDTPFTQDDGISTTWLDTDEATSNDPGLLRGASKSTTGRSGWEFVNSP